MSLPLPVSHDYGWRQGAVHWAGSVVKNEECREPLHGNESPADPATSHFENLNGA